MATFSSRLDDWRWLFMEKGLMHVHSELRQFANSLPGGNITISGARTFGAIDMQTAADVATVVTKTVNPAGQFNVGNTGSNPPVVKAPPTDFRT